MNDRIFNKDERKDFQETVLSMCREKNFSDDDIESIVSIFTNYNKQLKHRHYEYKIFLRNIEWDIPRDLYDSSAVRYNEEFILYEIFDPTLGGRILVMVFNKD